MFILSRDLILRLTSFRDGLMGCTQSQSLQVIGSLANPAIETAIKSSISVSLYVMWDRSISHGEA